ncbi:MAG: sugar ABC transporter permease [Clostridia bacterium]|nr:sugar ABC transporter permease [Clostridia bacterium]
MAKEPVNAVKERADWTKRDWRRYEMKKNKVAYLFVAPYMILFTVFTVAPVVLSFLLSFTSFNMLEWPKMVWLDNYLRLFLADDIFLTSVKNTFLFAVITGPASYLLCLFFAWFINELTPKIRSFVTLIFYAPAIAGNVYLIWGILFSGDSYGYVNGWLLKMGLISEPILFFQNVNYIFPLIIMVALWTSLGTSFLTFIAGFQNVDRTYYEAGAVDGVKNRWQELWFVTLPLMKNQMLLSAVLAITGAFGFGAIIDAMVGFPSPDYCVHTMVHHLNDYGNLRMELGYASAIATLLFLMMIGSNFLVRNLLKRVGK